MNGPVLVAAPDLRQAQLWARREKLARGQWRYARTPEDLLGLGEGTVVMVNSHRLGRRVAWEAELRLLEAVGVTVLRGST